MLIAVLDRGTAGCRSASCEVYVATVGGIAARRAGRRPRHRAGARVGRARARPSRRRLCAIGEVSLSGDVRRVPNLGRRLAEAARLGFTTALVPGRARRRGAARRAGRGRAHRPGRDDRRRDGRRSKPGPARGGAPRRAALRADRRRQSTRRQPCDCRRQPTRLGAERSRLTDGHDRTRRGAARRPRPGRARHRAARRPRTDPARQHRRADRHRLGPQSSRSCAPAASRSTTSSSPRPGCASCARWTARSC